MHTRRIMKFGGSSLADPKCFYQVRKLIRSHIDKNPLVVVSALGAENDGIKITDTLKGICAGLLNREPRDADIQAVKERHRQMAGQLELPVDLLAPAFEKFQQAVDRISRGEIKDEPRAMDLLMGFGEYFSSVLMAAFLKADGLDFEAADPAAFGMVTNDNFQNADVLDESLNVIASHVIGSRTMLVFPGFIGVTADGAATTLGRGGSDYTAAILGAALKRPVEIWTDVDGIYSINPKFLPEQFRRVGHPRTIPELSYEEARQMASFGSRVLHRKSLDAVHQAVSKGKHIHLYIKNTFNPEHPGTVITSHREGHGFPRGITCLENTQLLTIYPKSYGEGMQLARRLEEIPHLTPVLASQTWGRVAFVFDSYSPELSQLESEFDSHLSRDQVLVKVVGDGIGENPAALSRIHSALSRAEDPDKFGMTVVHKSPQLLTDNTFELIVKKRGIDNVLRSLYKDLFMQDIVTVGILGMGTVGGGVLRYARDLYSSEKSGFQLNFPRALVRDVNRKREVPFDGEFTTDVNSIIEDPLVDIVLEVMGGLEPAREYVLRALKNGKDVVTANKALLARYGAEIFAEADRRRKNVGFEASVCGEIPIIEDFLKFPGLADIEGLQGIVNGTSNYVLTRFAQGMSFEQAITLAQEKGFAEADPTMDISGADAAQKLSILASVLFNQKVDYNAIPVQGIDGLTPVDGRVFRSWGVTVKPLVVARVVRGQLSLFVGPALVDGDHPLSPVKEENNALSLYLSGREDPITKVGKGAGAIPTARSILRDILEVSRKSRSYMVDVPQYFATGQLRPLAPADSFEARWYVRYTVEDTPGVMGKVATILGDFGLSIFRIYQEKHDDGDSASILFELKQTTRAKLARANDMIRRFPFVREIFSCMML